MRESRSASTRRSNRSSLIASLIASLIVYKRFEDMLVETLRRTKPKSLVVALQAVDERADELVRRPRKELHPPL